ncbi:MAG: transposase [Bacteroidetes bacterium]|nr:transposase [Bacteroidota bacterium]
MEELKIEYRRNLPHFLPQGATFFITFRLDGSLPVSVIKELKEEAKILEDQIKNNVKDRLKRKRLIYGQRKLFFGKFEQLLNRGETGPIWLKDDPIRKVVADAIHYRDKIEFNLICYSIMHNHVHMVIDELTKPLYRIMQSLKRYTARESNKLIDREGSFWQAESYDHVVRNQAELIRIINYTVKNPVKAGLVKNWKDWKFSYCSTDWQSVIEIGRIANQSYKIGLPIRYTSWKTYEIFAS